MIRAVAVFLRHRLKDAGNIMDFVKLISCRELPWIFQTEGEGVSPPMVIDHLPPQVTRQISVGRQHLPFKLGGTLFLEGLEFWSGCLWSHYPCCIHFIAGSFCLSGIYCLEIKFSSSYFQDLQPCLSFSSPMGVEVMGVEEAGHVCVRRV